MPGSQGGNGMLPTPMWSAKMWEDVDQVEFDDGSKLRPVHGRRIPPGLMQPVHKMGTTKRNTNRRYTSIPRGSATVTIDHPSRDPFDSPEARWAFYRKMIIPPKSRKGVKRVNNTNWLEFRKVKRPRRKSRAARVDRLLAKGGE